MPPSRGDLERTFGRLLSLHISEIRNVANIIRKLCDRWVQYLRAFHMIDERNKRGAWR